MREKVNEQAFDEGP